MAEIFPTLVYLLSFLASLMCAILLGRSYVHTKTRLLFWSALCFALLAVVNLVVVIDMLILPDVNLRPARLWLTLAAVSVLLFGFLWAQDEQ